MSIPWWSGGGANKVYNVYKKMEEVGQQLILPPPPHAFLDGHPGESGGVGGNEISALEAPRLADDTARRNKVKDKAAFLANAPATIAPVLPPVAVKPPAGAQQSSSTNNMATITPIYSTVTTAAGTNMHGLNEKSDLGRRFHRLHFPCPFR